MMGYTLEPSQSRNDKYTDSELSAMTVSQIRQLASDNGYSLSATNKAGIISEFLMYQG